MAGRLGFFLDAGPFPTSGLDIGKTCSLILDFLHLLRRARRARFVSECRSVGWYVSLAGEAKHSLRAAGLLIKDGRGDQVPLLPPAHLRDLGSQFSVERQVKVLKVQINVLRAASSHLLNPLTDSGEVLQALDRLPVSSRFQESFLSAPSTSLQSPERDGHLGRRARRTQ